MTANLIVILTGILLSIGVAWFFWGGKRKGVRAALTSGGYQEALVLVKGGYSPDRIIVQRGKPVRLSFLREESNACSETVVFPDFRKSARLPEGRTVPIEFIPDTAGEFDFQCQMGMFRGKLVVQ
ncbi:MAG: cupredoxin domain-containing protein [Rhodothermales bacterium]